jgi:hypothetical protein
LTEPSRDFELITVPKKLTKAVYRKLFLGVRALVETRIPKDVAVLFAPTRKEATAPTTKMPMSRRNKLFIKSGR